MSDNVIPVIVLPTVDQVARLERFGWVRWGSRDNWWVNGEGVTTHWALALGHISGSMAHWIGEAIEHQAPYFGREITPELLGAVAGDVLSKLDAIEFPARCESCGSRATVRLEDGSQWCNPCDAAAIALGYNAEGRP